MSRQVVDGAREGTEAVALARRHRPDAPLLAFGVVASTGGPPALAQLLSLLPAPLPFPLLLAQHLSEGISAGLHRWLSEVSTPPVELARAGLRPRPGRAYLAPGGHHLRVDSAGTLQLERAPAEEPLSPSGDVLFHSLAQAFGGAAGGAVLTGMGRDGASGLRALHRAGGPTCVQCPDTCVIAGMPRAALRACPDHRVLTLPELATWLSGLSRPRPLPPPARRSS
jgi:two-component system chemotaxis response regulator CheB